MKKQLIFIVLAIMTFCSCEPRAISQGRTAYKEYFNNTLKDPQSLVIYKEEVIAQDKSGATFVLDAGARNTFGGMVRDTYTIRTIGASILDVKEYDVRTLPKEEPKTEEENFNFTYKQKMSPVAGFDAQKYIGKTFVLKDSCIHAHSASSLSDAITAAKRKDIKQFKKSYGDIFPSGTKLKIISAKDNTFEVEYKIGEYTTTCYIEESSIF